MDYVLITPGELLIFTGVHNRQALDLLAVGAGIEHEVVGPPLDDPEIRDWMDMEPIGREFDAPDWGQFAQPSPGIRSEGHGDKEQVPTDDDLTRTSVPMGQLLVLIKDHPEMTLTTPDCLM